MSMTKAERQGYVMGQKMLALQILTTITPYLEGKKEASATMQIIEAKAVLKDMFEGLGLEFDPELHLADLCRRLAAALHD